MYNILSIVGTSNSGKTTLIEKIVFALSNKGYRIATIKHNMHHFEIDKEGKDTFKHKKAGAIAVIISGPDKVALIKDVPADQEVDELTKLLPPDIDLVITEGYKRGNKPKIEIYRGNTSNDFICKNDKTCVAIVTDDINNPLFSAVENKFHIEKIDALTTYIENNFIKNKDNQVELIVDDDSVPLNQFVKETLISTVTGLIKPLKGCNNPKKITITVKLNK